MNGEKELVNQELEEIQEASGDAVEKINDSIESSIELEKELTTNKSKNLHNNLVDKLTQSKIAAQMKHDEYLKMHQELAESTANFMRLENHIVKTTVATSISLLQDLGVENLEEGAQEAKEIVQENKADLLKIKPLSKGNIKALFFGTIGALVTVSGLTTFGAKLASLPLNSATFLQRGNLDTIANKLSSFINIKDTPVAGYLLVGAISVLVGLIIYNLVTFLQKRKNAKYVEKLEGDVEKYTEELDKKIDKSNALKEHLDNIKLVMQKYDIILQEQNSKIRRMQFIEQPEEGVNSLQRASQVEVEKTVLLLDELLKLMNSPLNDGLTITQESQETLHSANSIINEVIKKLYV